jgi:maleylacetoacetate isomerase/maleylpyruvate isomerase
VKLYTLHRNSAGERVRIALNLKGIEYEYVSYATLGRDAYRRINPQGLLPTLEVDGRLITQSPAILQFLEEMKPEPTLLPGDPILRAQARAFGQVISSEMHALTVLRVRRLLGRELGVPEDGLRRWVGHWLGEGLATLEAMLQRRPTAWPFCYGDRPGWADLHLVPQIRNARRLGCDLAPYPLLTEVESRCVPLDAFRRARPEAQPDFSEQDPGLAG